MRPRRVFRAALLLALLVAVALEGVAWLRIPLEAMVHRAYPQVALDGDGRAIHYDIERVSEEGRQRVLFHLLDDRRAFLETRRDRVLAGGPGVYATAWRLRTQGRPALFDHPLFLMASLGDALAARVAALRQGPLDAIANALNRMEGTRRGMSPHATVVVHHIERLPGGGEAVSPGSPLVEWRAEAGRLICREVDPRGAGRSPGRVLAGLGPDGFVTGETGANGASFDAIAGVSFHANRWWLLEREPRRLLVLSMAGQPEVPLDSIEALHLGVEARPLHAMEGSVAPDAKTRCWIARLDGAEHVLFLDDGSIFARFAVEPDEQIVRGMGVRPLTEVTGPMDYWDLPDSVTISTVAAGIETSRSRTAPDLERRRLRLFRVGQPPVAHDSTLEPTRASEWLPANLAASLALLRPLALNATSAASSLSDNWHDWWWRDPWLAGGRYAFWLVLSFVLAGFLAWRARRSARARCATPREVRFWTAAVFLLGPIGLLWMRLVLPRVPVESVGGSRRAVNLDASPSTTAPWPDPKPLGIEVFS